jgi:hypothetical protein
MRVFIAGVVERDALMPGVGWSGCRRPEKAHVFEEERAAR